MSDRPIHHYYHVYAAGDWRTAVEQHITAMNEADFFPDFFTVGIVGPPENREEVLDFLTDHNWMPDAVVEADEGWEHLTIDTLYEMARDLDFPFYILYAHTKGAAYPAEINELWRAVMTKFTVTRWEECVQKLEGHFHAVGAFFNQYMEGQTPYFAGNFWWARSESIAELGKCPDNSRYEAEVWVGRINSQFGHPIYCNHNSSLTPQEFRKAL